MAARHASKGTLVYASSELIRSFLTTLAARGLGWLGEPESVALLERRIKVFFVTHMYELARSFYAPNAPKILFLRAERQADGQRTFKLHEGEPLPTSFGQDVYRKIFHDLGQQNP